MRLVILSEMNLAGGSGYTTIARNVVKTLGERGHEIVAVAFNYDGCEHWLPAAVVGCDPRMLTQHIRLLVEHFRPDALVGISDITKHTEWQPLLTLGVPYAGIFPLESDPLIHPSEWTRIIDIMDVALVETEWATAACHEIGLDARHFPVGIDTEFWRPPEADERQRVRDRLGVGDKWVLLTVADNHERKNLPAVFATTALLLGRAVDWPPGSGRAGGLIDDETADDYYLIVNTKRRPDALGYDLWALGNRFEIQNETTFYQHERQAGLGDEQLRELYWGADTFLLLSKAEGLGLPVMEAMACGVPCVCTDAGGMAENLADRRGWLVPAEYSYLDPFGNQVRRYPSPYAAAEMIHQLRSNGPGRRGKVTRALKWARSRTWAQAVTVLEEAINDITQSKAQATPIPPAPWPEAADGATGADQGVC